MEANNRNTLLLIIAFLAGVYIFLFSESGLIERIHLKKNRSAVTGRIEKLKAENARLGNEIKRNDGEEFKNSDTRKAGFIREGEKVVKFKGIPPDQPAGKDLNKTKKPGSYLFYVRIIWLAVSVLIIGLYFFNKKRAEAQ